MSSCEQYSGPNPLLTGRSGQKVTCQSQFLEWQVASERGDVSFWHLLGTKTQPFSLAPFIANCVPHSRKQLRVCEQAAQNSAVSD